MSQCQVDSIRTSVDPAELDRSSTAFLAVAGMGCPTCAARVRNALVLTEGVLEAEVDHQYGIAAVSYLPESVTVDALVRSVAAASVGTHHEYRALPIPAA